MAGRAVVGGGLFTEEKYDNHPDGDRQRRCFQGRVSSRHGNFKEKILLEVVVTVEHFITGRNRPPSPLQANKNNTSKNVTICQRDSCVPLGCGPGPVRSQTAHAWQQFYVPRILN